MSYPNDQGNPEGAIPVYQAPAPGGGTFNDYSAEFTGGQTDNAAGANPARRYLFIQAQGGIAISFSMTGGTGEPGTAGAIALAAGQAYESGPVVPTGAVNVWPASTAFIVVLEG